MDDSEMDSSIHGIVAVTETWAYDAGVTLGCGRYRGGDVLLRRVTRSKRGDTFLVATCPPDRLEDIRASRVPVREAFTHARRSWAILIPASGDAPEVSDITLTPASWLPAEGMTVRRVIRGEKRTDGGVA